MAGDDKGTGPAKPRPQATKKAAEKKADPKPTPAPTPESIGIEGTIRVGGHVIGDAGWQPEEED